MRTRTWLEHGPPAGIQRGGSCRRDGAWSQGETLESQSGAHPWTVTVEAPGQLLTRAGTPRPRALTPSPQQGAQGWLVPVESCDF